MVRAVLSANPRFPDPGQSGQGGRILMLRDYIAASSRMVIGGDLVDLARGSAAAAMQQGLPAARLALRELRKAERWWLEGRTPRNPPRALTPFTAARMDLDIWIKRNSPEAPSVLEALVDCFEQMPRPRFRLSEAVSVARALRRLVQLEARRRQAHGATAPGRPGTIGSTMRSREFVARCVGVSPATLRKAEVVVAAYEHEPDDPVLRNHVLRMDADYRSGPAYRALSEGRWSRIVLFDAPAPAGLEYGEKLVAALLCTARKSKRSGARSGNLPVRDPKRLGG